jgi:hypothetical protein
LSADSAAALGVKVGDVVRYAPMRPSMNKALPRPEPAARSVA